MATEGLPVYEKFVRGVGGVFESLAVDERLFSSDIEGKKEIERERWGWRGWVGRGSNQECHEYW